MSSSIRPATSMPMNTSVAHTVVILTTSSGESAARCSDTRVQGVHDVRSAHGGASRTKSQTWYCTVYRMVRSTTDESATVMMNSRKRSAARRDRGGGGSMGMAAQRWTLVGCAGEGSLASMAWAAFIRACASGGRPEKIRAWQIDHTVDAASFMGSGAHGL
ncbi:hypothetical protein DFH06DRAFT_1190028 [Mycena polygramma]|nr:hypothetical protein DFH06DRAFT_1190028 [Mycena polygramma]